MSTDSYVNFLYKKIQGAPFTSAAVGPLDEQIGASALNILPSQIWKDDIPPTAPECNTIEIISYNSTYAATRNTNSGAYSHIVHYTNVLLTSPLNPNICFYYAGTDAENILGTNILIGAIPFYIDTSTQSYKPHVYYSATNTGTDAMIEIPSRLWVFDGTTGYLTFFSSAAAYPFVYISFWKYEGTTGISSSSSSSSSSIMSFSTFPITANSLTPLLKFTLDANSYTFIELLPTTFDTTDNSNSWTSVTVTIMNDSTMAILSTPIQISTTVITRILSFSTSLTNSTSAPITAVICMNCVTNISSITYTYTTITQSTNPGQVKLTTYPILPSQNNIYDSTLIKMKSIISYTYNSSNVKLFTLGTMTDLLKGNTKVGVVNVWGNTPRWFSDISDTNVVKYCAANDGSVYVAGSYTTTSTFIIGSTTYVFTNTNSASDIFIVKINRYGVAQWAAKIQSTLRDVVQQIVTDSNFNVYVCGLNNTGAGNNGSETYIFPGTLTGPGTGVVLYPKTDQAVNGLLVKYNSNGTISANALIRGFYNDKIQSVAVNLVSVVFGGQITYNTPLTTINVYDFAGNLFPTTYAYPTSNQLDVIVCRINNNTNATTLSGSTWISRIGSNQTENIGAVDLDSNSNVYAYVEIGGSPLNIYNSNNTLYTNTVVAGDMIIKYNSSGMVQWVANIVGNIVALTGTLVITKTYLYAQFIVTNTTGSNVTIPNVGGTSTVRSTAANASTLILLQYNLSGALIWINTMVATTIVDPVLSKSAFNDDVYIELSHTNKVTVTHQSSSFSIGSTNSDGSVLLKSTSLGVMSLVCRTDSI
jgi:hypothetical protein